MSLEGTIEGRAAPPRTALLRSLIGAASGNSLGMLVAQAIALGSMIYVARLFTPADLGLLGTVMALVAVLAPLATLSFANGIPVAANRGRAIILSWLSLVGALAMMVALGLLAVVGSAIGVWQGGELLLVALGVPMMALNSVATQFSLRLGLIGVRAAAVIFGALIVAAVRLFTGLAEMDGTALVLAAYAGLLVTSAVLLLFGTGFNPLEQRRFLSIARARKTASLFRQFPYYSTPHALLRYGSLALPPLALGQFIGPDLAGQYTLAATAVAGPLLVVADAVGSAIVAPLSAEFRRDAGAALAHARKLTAIFLAVVVPAAILAWMILPWLFGLGFGEGWEVAADFSRWLLLWAAAMLVTRPMVSLLAVRQRLDGSFRIEMLLSLLRLSGLAAGLFLFDDVTLAIALFALAGVLGSLLNYRIASRPDHPLQ